MFQEISWFENIHFTFAAKDPLSTANAKVALEQKVSKKAQSKLRKAKVVLERIDQKAVSFQAEVIKRKGYLEEIFWRFPHIGELMIDQLDNQSLTKVWIL